MSGYKYNRLDVNNCAVLFIDHQSGTNTFIIFLKITNTILIIIYEYFFVLIIILILIF